MRHLVIDDRQRLLAELVEKIGPQRPPVRVQEIEPRKARRFMARCRRVYYAARRLEMAGEGA